MSSCTWKSHYFMVLWICKEKLHKIKKGTFSFQELNVYPNKIGIDTYSMNECHFSITTIIMIVKNKMIIMCLRNFIIKVLVFIISSPLSIWDWADTQQLIFPIWIIAEKCIMGKKKMYYAILIHSNKFRCRHVLEKAFILWYYEYANKNCIK